MSPTKPKKPCAFRGCPELTNERYCDKHKKMIDSEYNRTSRAFIYLYNTSRWKILRKQFLREHPLCEECKKNGVVKAATIVDHIKAHKGDEKLFWDQNNWQALCKHHHDQKTVKEDGRFGDKNKVYDYSWKR